MAWCLRYAAIARAPVLRRSVAGVITATLPIMLLIGLGADLLVRRVFGEAYAPAVNSLRVLVLLFAFT